MIEDAEIETDVGLAEQRKREEYRKVENALWEMEMERLEWERLQNDLFPGIKPEVEE